MKATGNMAVLSAAVITVGSFTTPTAHAGTHPAAPTSTPGFVSSSAAQVAAPWHRLWGPSKISADYLNLHHKKWISGTFVPRSQTKGTFRCWNNRDGGKAKLQIYRVEKGKVIKDSGWKLCDWTVWSISTGSYRRGEGLRFILRANGHAHTTQVTAYTR